MKRILLSAVAFACVASAAEPCTGDCVCISVEDAKALGIAVPEAAAAAGGSDGAALYKKCVACHGADAKTVYLSKVPAIKEMSPEDFVQSLKTYKDGSNNKYGMGAIMKSQVGAMSDEDFTALGEYVKGL